jgi:type II secretory pathway component PulC
MMKATVAVVVVLVWAAVAPPAGSFAQAPAPPDLRLVGLILGDSGKARAMIEDVKTRKQTLYRVGEVVNGQRIVRILEDRVVFSSSAGEVELRLAGIATAPSAVAAAPPPAPPAPPDRDPSIPRIPRDTLLRLSARPDLIAHVAPAGDRGFEVREAPAGGFFAALRLKRGDVIRTVNHQRLRGTGAVAQQVGRVLGDEQEPYLRIEFERAGKSDVAYFDLRP